MKFWNDESLVNLFLFGLDLESVELRELSAVLLKKYYLEKEEDIKRINK